MRQRSSFRIQIARGARRIVVLTSVSAMLSLGDSADAQTRWARDTATGCDALLYSKAKPGNLSQSRIYNRINSQLDRRLDLCVERHRSGGTNELAAAFEARQIDRARVGTDSLSPLSTSTSASLSQAYDASSQPSSSQRSSGRTGDVARLRWGAAR